MTSEQKALELVEPAVLRELLDYNPQTGALTWLKRNPRWFKSQRDCDAWNTRYAGKLANYAGRRGYVVVRLFGKSIGGHRIAWAIHHGKWPELMIDHINGVCSDNRIENLREADSRSNMMNMKQNRHNKTGTPGVRWRKEMQKWAAEIGGYPNRHYLGSFESLEEAVAARKRAEQMLGYHPNHGQPLDARGLAIVKKDATNG